MCHIGKRTQNNLSWFRWWTFSLLKALGFLKEIMLSEVAATRFESMIHEAKISNFEDMKYVNVCFYCSEHILKAGVRWWYLSWW